MKTLMGTQKLVKVCCELGSFKAILFHLDFQNLVFYMTFLLKILYTVVGLV